jgi:hypothetical protein
MAKLESNFGQWERTSGEGIALGFGAVVAAATEELL